MLFQIECNNALKNIKRIKTSTFKWMLNNIIIKKIISVPIWATKLFFEVSALLDVRHYPTLQSRAISRKTNVATLRKFQKP